MSFWNWVGLAIARQMYRKASPTAQKAAQIIVAKAAAKKIEED